MAKTKQLKSQEKFKTMIGGQALIEGIMDAGAGQRRCGGPGQGGGSRWR